MTFVRNFTASLAATALIATPLAAAAPSNLADLVGAKGAGGETQLEARGYVLHHAAEADDGKYTYWWNASRKDCVRVLTSDGRYSAIKSTTASDCGQKGSSNDKAAAIAIGAAALIGVAALASKSHHRDDKDYDERGTADFERGYRDGLYNESYHNYSRSDAYADGYQAGVREHGQQTSYRDHGGYGGYQPYSDYNDLVGRSNDFADAQLGRRGFRYQGKDEKGSGHERTYWNGRTKQCISVRTNNGNVTDINSIKKRNCD
jgi:hypothetical protein